MVDTTIGAALKAAYEALSAVSDSARLDAQILLAHVTGSERVAFIAHPERILPLEQARVFDALVAQAATGTPIAYLTGVRAFYRYELRVTPDVLIPRPETEHLVEAALAWCRQRHARGDGLTIVDVGTGSGAIALSLSAELPGAAVCAVDISPAVLAVVRENAERLGLGNVCFGQGHLLGGLPAGLRPDVITANLPYIPSNELDTLDVVKHEPRLALDGGPDGLDLIRELVIQAAAIASEPFCLLLEIGAGQGAAVSALCRDSFPGARVRVIQDYAGHDRVVEVSQ